MKNGTNLRLSVVHGARPCLMAASEAGRQEGQKKTQMVTGEELVTGYHHKLLITR